MNKCMTDRLLMDEDERRRLQRLNRRTWGAVLSGVGIVLLVFFVVGLLFLFWLANLVDGSPTIS
jgi:hypothetical protein